MIDIDELEKIAEAATPGPWASYETRITYLTGKVLPTFGVHTTWINQQSKDFDLVISPCVRYVDGETMGLYVSPGNAAFIAVARDAVPALIDEVRRLRKLDAEAATHVESVIALRSAHFTGDGEYVGWRGLGKALREDYDERDRLRALLREAADALQPFSREIDTWNEDLVDGDVVMICDLMSEHPVEAEFGVNDLRAARATAAALESALALKEKSDG